MDNLDLFLENIRNQSTCYVDEVVKARDLICGPFPDILHRVNIGPPQY